MPIILNGSGGITYPDSTLATTAYSSRFRNRIINGSSLISQRGSINISAGGGVTYTAVDRFALNDYWGSGQINTVQSSSAPTGFTNSLGLTVATAVPFSGSTGYYCDIVQCIEGYNIADLYGSTVTLSFWVKSSITGTYSITFGNAMYLGSANRFYVANYTINAANTWEQKTISVSLSSGTSSGTWNTTNGIGLAVFWNLGAESNRKGDGALNTWQTLPYSGGYPLQSATQTNWASTLGATFNLTGVQLEVGSVASAFEYVDYSTQLTMCQRYYQKSLPVNTAPSAASGNYGATISAISNSTNYIWANHLYRVPMRTAPTLTFYTANGGASGYVRTTASGSNVAVTAIDWFSESGIGGFTAPGASTGTLYDWIYTASAEL